MAGKYWDEMMNLSKNGTDFEKKHARRELDRMQKKADAYNAKNDPEKHARKKRERAEADLKFWKQKEQDFKNNN